MKYRLRNLHLIFEPKDGLERPITLSAMVMASVGALLHAGIVVWEIFCQEK